MVTPNEDRAGRDDPFEWGQGGEYGPQVGVVFSAGHAEFDRYSVQLAQLAELNKWSSIPKHRVSELRGFDVIRFIERRIVSSGRLQPRHAALLCVTMADRSPA